MLTVKSVADLNQTIVTHLHRIPRQVDVIVGVPRSGLMAASMLALHLQKPLADLDGICRGVAYRRAARLAAPARHILLIDDTVNHGKAMAGALARVKAARPELAITTAAVYSAPATEPGMVDLALELCPTPRAFAWNLWKHCRLPRWGFDLDGVFCRDPSSRENDDGAGYLEFIRTVPPRFLPTRPIGHIVTCRLEQYRAATEAWLAAHDITYASLTMLDLPSKAARQAQGGRASWKAEQVARLGVELFIESDPGQARKIAARVGIPVWCTTTQTVALAAAEAVELAS
jgi:uncharacterized HAD superfamily protein